MREDYKKESVNDSGEVKKSGKNKSAAGKKGTTSGKKEHTGQRGSKRRPESEKTSSGKSFNAQKVSDNSAGGNAAGAKKKRS